jgi:hypothetical protein
MYVAGVVGTFLIMAALVGLMRRYIRPTPVNEARIAERRKAAADASLAGHQLESYTVIDAAKGLYQLRISQAMEMIIHGSKDPALARSNLLARVEKFNPPPPKPLEPPPSQFE